MDALLLTIEMLSLSALPEYFSKNVPHEKLNSTLLVQLLKGTKTRLLYSKNQVLIERVQVIAHKVVNFMSKFVAKAGSSEQSSSSGSHDLLNDWREIQNLIFGMKELCDSRKFFETKLHTELSCDDIERIEKMLLETADCSNCETLDREQGQLLLIKKAIPGAKRIPMQLESLPLVISQECGQEPLALLLIGGLLLHKPIAYDIWNRVTNNLYMINESIMSAPFDNMPHIIKYCFDDLPYFLKLCFLYFACYPIGYEIPATSLINIWIAEGFVTPSEEEWVDERYVTQEKEETREEIANKYLEQLVQRSLVCVSKRSFIGTIKSCRVPRLIHEFAIQQSYKDDFLVANPDQEKIKSVFRLAIHHDNEKQYSAEVKLNHILSFLAFNLQRNVLGSAVLLRVLELRKSAIPVTTLPNMIYLRYLVLRGSTISELPQNIGDMKNLQTLDVRDTSIETLPESLWNISALCHVYLKPSPQIKGPPSAANIPDLQILKTVVAHDSWQENIPHFLVHLRKLALSNWNNLAWKSISNLLSHMDKLITMAIIGNIIPSEFADIRAFPNLKTVKSIKLEGEWNCRKLFIDNVKFPPNLTKLTLTKTGLKEDPMPTLERLQTLKILSLQDGAYTGKQMVCSANGFPQLQFLELKKLDNLENWEVKPMALSQLTALRIVQCQKLIGNHPNLDHVTDKVIG